MARTRGRSVAVFVFSEHRSFILGSFIGVSLSLLPFMILISYHFSVQLNPVSCGLAGSDEESMVVSSAGQRHPNQVERSLWDHCLMERMSSCQHQWLKGKLYLWLLSSCSFGVLLKYLFLKKVFYLWSSTKGECYNNASKIAPWSRVFKLF